jgi:di/tricarboxylate transporter/CRP-like cAMP-binding protein
VSERQQPVAAAQALAEVPMFAALEPVDLAKLAGVLEERWFDAGSVIFEAGGEGDGLYIMREGVAERRVSGSAIDRILPYESFGQLSLLTDEPRSASVVSVSAVRVWMLPRVRFDSLLRGEPDLMLHLSAAIGLDLARTRRALGELQREVDTWVAGRLRELDAGQRELVEAAALFDRAPLAVLARLAGVDEDLARIQLAALARQSPLLRDEPDGYRVPVAIARALQRGLQAEHRHTALAARVCAIAVALEGLGQRNPAAAAYRAAGAESDALRLRGRAGATAGASSIPAAAAAGESSGAPALVDDTRPTPAASALPARGPLPWRRLAGFGLALLPLSLWTMAPPDGLGVAGWQALLTVVAAAILFATEALAEEVIALALVASWVVTGLVAPRVALDGFASQPWVLVLAVLAVGVAVGNTGLMYRVALAALGRRPAGFASRCVTLALVGTAVTPTLPNATSRTALAAPMVREIAEALGFAPGGRAATGLALAALIGFGQMAGLFLTGSSVGLLVHGLLPDAIRLEFGFARWFIAALPLHLLLFAGGLLGVVWLYRPSGTAANPGDRLALQRAVLGPMRSDEKLCLAVLIGLIAGFLSEPWHGINGAWLGVGALVVLALGRALDTTMVRTGVNWPFLLFFGAISSLATVFTTLGIDTWLGARLAGLIQSMALGSLSFCLALAVVGFCLSFIVRWQAAAPLLTLVALPAAAAAQVHPFLVALVALVSTQVWFLPYQSTVYLALYHGSGECFSHAHARALAWLWGGLVLVAIALSMPVWRLMGLVGA